MRSVTCGRSGALPGERNRPKSQSRRNIQLSGDRRCNAKLGGAPVFRNVQVPRQRAMDGRIVSNCQSGWIAHGRARTDPIRTCVCWRIRPRVSNSGPDSACSNRNSPHPIFVRLVLAKKLPGLFHQALVSTCRQRVAALLQLRPAHFLALFRRSAHHGRSSRDGCTLLQGTMPTRICRWAARLPADR